MKVITAVLRPDCVSADTRVAIPYSHYPDSESQTLHHICE